MGDCHIVTNSRPFEYLSPVAHPECLAVDRQARDHFDLFSESPCRMRNLFSTYTALYLHSRLISMCWRRLAIHERASRNWVWELGHTT